MKKNLILVFFSFFVLTASAVGIYESSPVGFGGISAADGSSPVTYGVPICNSNGEFVAPDGYTLVTCSSLSEIESALGNNKIIMVESGNYGTLSIKNAAYDGLSIIGKGNVVFSKISISKAKVVLIRNVSILEYGTDGLPVTAGSANVWVDHCTVGWTETSSNKEKPDGAWDITGNGKLYMTISWCKIMNAWKTMLHGSSDSDADLTDRYITHYCNYYYNTHQRTPRIRGGKTHILNCFYENSGWARPGTTEYEWARKAVYADDGEYLKNRLVVSDGYAIMATNKSDVVIENNFFLDVRWPIVCSTPCDEFSAKYGELQSPDICNGCVTSRTANDGVKYCRQTGNEYDDSGLSDRIRVKVNPASCPSGNCETQDVPLDFSYEHSDGTRHYVIRPEMLNPGKRSIKFDDHDPENAFTPPYAYSLVSASQARVNAKAFAGADKIPMVCCTGEPTLACTSGNKDQENIAVIEPITFQYGGGAVNVLVEGLPAEAKYEVDPEHKVVTISGLINSDINYTVRTMSSCDDNKSISGTLTRKPQEVCSSMVRVPFEDIAAGSYAVKVFDSSDAEKLVISNNLSLPEGNTDFMISTEGWASGTYTCKIMSGSTTVKSYEITVQ
jgi:pectate lyase/uncharacterized protein (DUF2141 family)